MLYVKLWGCDLFAYNWKLPAAYSGAFLLTIAFGSFSADTSSFFTYSQSFLLTIEAFVLTMGKCF